MLGTGEQAKVLAGLFEQGSRLEYKKGELIIRPGETPSGVFYIESGLVKAYGITKYGEENLLVIRKPKEIFPLIWALKANNWHVIYEALAPTVVYRLEREKFYKAISSQNELLVPLLDLTIDMYRIHSQRILNLEYRTVRERLISFLLIMSRRFGKKTKDGIQIEAPLKHQDIASSINSSRETTSREITALERKGLIKNSQSLITLVDVKELKSNL